MQQRSEGLIVGWLRSLAAIVFPPQCACCGAPLLDNEDTICTICRYDMPMTGYECRKNNHVVDLFAGKALFETASALMFFKKGTHYQRMIHRMKYSGRDDIARVLGEIYGAHLAESGLYKDVDIVVSVPLHFTKKIKRGYNQSAEFARGIARSMNIDSSDRVLGRRRKTKTQARMKSKEHRADNVGGAFVVKRPQIIEGKNVLLVDDVVTTGATIEACAVAINEAVATSKLYLGAIAVVEHG